MMNKLYNQTMNGVPPLIGKNCMVWISLHPFDDFVHPMIMSLELEVLCDDLEDCSHDIKNLMLAVHHNLSGASGGGRNHNLARVKPVEELQTLRQRWPSF
jgi:hypothetical protein